MHYPVLVHSTPEGRYWAVAFNLPEYRVEAATKEEAVRKLQAALVGPEPQWEIVDLEVPSESSMAQFLRCHVKVFREIMGREAVEAGFLPPPQSSKEEAEESEEDGAWEELETLSAQVREQLEREGVTAEQVLAELHAVRRELFIEKYGEAFLEEWENQGVNQP